MGGRMFSGFLILFGFTLIFAHPPVNKNELDNLDPYPNLDDPSDYYKPLSSDEFFDVLSDEFDEDNDSLYDGRIHHNQKRENLDEYTGENEPEATTENVEAGERDGDVVTGDATTPPLVNEEEGNEEESTQSPVHEDEEEEEGKQEEPSEDPVTEEEETQPRLTEKPTQPPLIEEEPTQPPLTEEEPTQPPLTEEPIQPPVVEEETNDESIQDPVDEEEEGKPEESPQPPAIAEEEEEEEKPKLESSMDEEHRDSEDGAKGRSFQELEQSQQYSATETPEDEDFEMKIKYFPDGVEEPRQFGPQSRIVGGSKVTDRSKFAYIASFRFASGSHFCGASIIDDRNILTAAHCVFDENQRLFPAQRLLLVVGDLQVNKKTDDTVTRVVRHIFPHEDYNYKTFEHDIAILRIDSLGEFTNYVNKVDLATVRPEVGTDCVVSGWGKTSFGGSPSNVLMQVTVPIVSREDCMRNYGNSILDGMLCAGLIEGGKDACQGDSGGPLVCDDKLAGVVSWGKDCALKDHPGVYTDVAAYYDWIVKTQGIETGGGDVGEGPPEARTNSDVVEKRESFSYQASLRYKQQNAHFCSAAIIDAKHLVTTAHCIMSDGNVTNPETLEVVVGDLNIQKTSETTTYRTLSHIFTHEGYNQQTLENDIAVLRVSEPFDQWTAEISPIALADSSPSAYTTCTLSGWGASVSSNAVNEVLRYANIPIIESRTCLETFSNTLKQGMLCAGYFEKGKDACQGDSGSPLVCSAYLSGLVSWGHRCNNDGVPGIYTDVALYKKWVQDQTQKSSAFSIKVNLSVLALSTLFASKFLLL